MIFAVVGILIAAVTLAMTLHYYPLLPDPLPTHFGPGGEPDSWGPRHIFAFLSPVIQFFLIATMLLSHLAARSAKMVRHMNLGLVGIKLPVEQKMRLMPEALIMGDGAVLIMTVFLLFVQHQAMMVALGRQETINVTGMIAGVAAVLFWSICFIVRINKKARRLV